MYVGYDFGHDQQDRKGGNRNLEGFLALSFGVSGPIRHCDAGRARKTRARRTI
jgi:hypothetical protein